LEKRLREELEGSISHYRILESKLRALSPRYEGFASPRPASLETIQRNLEPDDLLLQYWLAEPSSVLWLVSRDSIRTVNLSPTREIEHQVRILRRAVANGDEGSFRRSMIAIGERVLPIEASAIRGKRIRIVRTGALQYVPFGGVPVGGKPLGSISEISLLPSASIAPLLDSNRDLNRTRSPIIVFADPVLDPRDERTDIRGVVSAGSDVPARLLRTRHLAWQVKKLEPRARVFLDFGASKESFLRPVLRDYEIVELGTHARVDPVHPELSGIVLTQVRKDGSAFDGIVRQNDIMARLELSADLVILNGCSTALGKDVAGEGLQSLVRALFYAGARSVLASHWDVDQEASFEFLRRFHRILLTRQARTPAEALQKTQAEMLRHAPVQYRSPLVYAAFSLYGN
jgi:CHAT domain-containing protein